MHAYLKLLSEGQTLTREQAAEAMRIMLQGEALPEETAAFLLGLRTRGETIQELVGFTETMREHAVTVDCHDPNAIDLCGTGGDASGTFNISTAATFVCAGAGVTVAKHGNRSVSSKSGSADVLEALGVKVDLRKEGVEFCLREVGMAFIFAPYFHPAMRYVMPVRKKLGVRTFFNILGPLCNPAGVRRQLIGAFNEEVAQKAASILAQLGAEHVVAVHADDGLDELSIAAPSTVFFVRPSDELEETPQGQRIEPEDHGLGRVPLDEIAGGDADENAGILRSIFEGANGPHRDVVVLNAAYALQASGRFPTIDDCFEAARESIDSGAALGKLEALIDASHDAPAEA